MGKLVENADFGQRKGAAIDALVQDSDLAGVEAIKAADCVDGNRRWRGKRGTRRHTAIVKQNIDLVKYPRKGGMVLPWDVPSLGFPEWPLSSLDFGPEVGARIIRVQLGELAKQLLGALVTRSRHADLDFDDLIAPHAVAGSRRHAFFAKAKLLPRLRAGGNFQQGASIDGRDLDLGAERGLADAHGDSEMNVISLAMEKGVITGANDHVQISGSAATVAGITFAWNADALSIARPCLDANFERLSAFDCAFAVTCRAGGDVLARTVTARAGHVEFHAAAGLLNGALSFALRADPWLFQIALSGAMGAGVATGDVEAHNAAAHGSPERYIDLVFEIGARFGTVLRRGGTPAAEHAAEDVAEAAATRAGPAASRRTSAFEQVGKIETTEIERDALRATLGSASRKTSEPTGAGRTAASIGFGGRGIDVVRVEAELIVDLAFLGIAEDIVRLRDRFKLFFGGLIARIDVRVVLPRELAESFADLLLGGILFDAEGLVIIFFGGSRHTSYWPSQV